MASRMTEARRRLRLPGSGPLRGIPSVRWDPRGSGGGLDAFHMGLYGRLDGRQEEATVARLAGGERPRGALPGEPVHLEIRPADICKNYEFRVFGPISLHAGFLKLRF